MRRSLRTRHACAATCTRSGRVTTSQSSWDSSPADAGTWSATARGRFNRLRGLLSSIFPALERVLDLRTKGALVLLTGYQTPAAIRRLGPRRLGTWLRNRKVYNAKDLAATVLAAADRRHTSLPGEKLTGSMVHALAHEIQALTTQIAEVDDQIAERRPPAGGTNQATQRGRHRYPAGQQSASEFVARFRGVADLPRRPCRRTAAARRSAAAGGGVRAEGRPEVGAGIPAQDVVVLAPADA
jgi:hypothetical protein